jgi:hypothetical protein
MDSVIKIWLIPGFSTDYANRNYTKLFELYVNQIVARLSSDTREVRQGKESGLRNLPESITQVTSALHWPDHRTCFRTVLTPSNDYIYITIESTRGLLPLKYQKKCHHTSCQLSVDP